MKVSHKGLQIYFDEKLPSAKELAELFTFHSFEIEGVEGDVIDAKILPDRAHFCLSHKGIAEEIEVLTGLKRKKKTVEEISALFNIENSVEHVKVKIEDKKFCRRYIARKIVNVSIGESDNEIKELLGAMGSRVINSVVDALNAVMFDIGQPLHAFDADKLEGNIVVRAAMDDEKITLLDGKEVTLTSSDFVIADDAGPLAIGGVKGGKRAEVTMDTKNIILESANFEPTSVRKTSTKYNLRNESSKRFENEITPELAIEGIEQVTALITELSHDAKAGPLSDFYPHPVRMATIVTTTEFINRKLGIEIPDQTIIEIIERLSIIVKKEKEYLHLTIPHHRLDLVVPEDIVEEVGRVYGYEKIEGTKQKPVSNNVPAHPAFYISEHIKNILADQGFFEAYLYAFTSNGDIEVAYPLASDKKALRTNLSEGMQRALEMNARNADLLFLDYIKMFEIGKVFTKEGEHTSLCLGIKRIKKEKGKSSIEDIREAREQLLKTLDLDITTTCTVDDTGGLMRLKGKQIGVINNIEGIMELNLDMLIPYIKVPSFHELRFGPAPKISYKPFSTYPFIVRDIAVFVPDSVTPNEIEKIILENGTELLLKHSLFDTFKKDGKISYAFRMIFQSFERTLTDEEVNVIMTAIEIKIKEKGWEVR